MRELRGKPSPILTSRPLPDRNTTLDHAGTRPTTRPMARRVHPAGHHPEPESASLTRRLAEAQLIQIAVVSCVIALAVGGLLSITDLLKAAHVRAAVAQIDTITSAVNTFRLKYNALPGDIPPSLASAYGFFSESKLGGTPGHQDGNGLIEGGAERATVPAGETLLLWRHLSDANLLPGSFGRQGNARIVETSGHIAGNCSDVDALLPEARIAPSQYIIAYASHGTNYFQLLPVAEVQATPFPSYQYGSQGIAPALALAVDSKFDDGVPDTGRVQARGLTGVNEEPSQAISGTQRGCVVAAEGQPGRQLMYNVQGDNPSSAGPCSLRIRMH